jgi:predicted Zn-dependent peptidase
LIRLLRNIEVQIMEREGFVFMNNQLPYLKTELKNGVRLILIPVPGVNSIASAVMVGVGSRYETRQINGISHFLEHMVFKGTKKYPTTDDVNVIERQGGLQNAYTDIDVTNFHNKVLATDWELGLEINKELALNPLIDQKNVDRERDVIIEEMKRYEDEPAAKVDEAFHAMMYPKTKLGMRIIGEAESLRAVASPELKKYHDDWYRPDRLVVVLAGNFSTPNNIEKIEAKVNEWFGDLIGKSAGGIEQVTDGQTEPKLNIVTKPDAQQAHLELGVRIFNRSSEARFAWNIFNLLMGVSFTSRLFREIREKRGLCYHIRSGANNWADVGYWSIYAGVATDKVEETVKATIEQLNLVVNSGVTQEEINIAKKRLKTMLAFRSEDPEFYTEYYGRQELFGEPIITLDEYVAKLDSVTKEEINSLIRKYIVTQTLNLALVWNKKADKDLLKFLKI